MFYHGATPLSAYVYYKSHYSIQYTPLIQCLGLHSLFPLWMVKLLVAVWFSGTALVLINVVALRRARLVLRWVTVCSIPSWYLTKATQA